jgi:T5SS/PEP-CTERM-associated repeat protein
MPVKSRSFHLTIIAALGFLGLGAALQTALADDYEWIGGDTGSFSSLEWQDETTSVNFMGSPGPDDTAFIPPGTVLSSSGGSVSTLSGGGLDLTGSFSAQSVNYLDLTGSGTLTAGSLGAEGANISVTGAHLIAGSAPGRANVDVNAGGSAVIQGSLPQGGGTASDPMSLLQVDGSVTNFEGGVANGGRFTAQSLSTDGTLAAIFQATGAGSTVSISGSAVFAGEGLTMSGGAQVTIGGDLDLYRPAGSVVDIGGSANISGAGNVLSVAGQVQLADGPNASPNASIGSMNIDGGSLLRAGSVTVDGTVIAGMITVGGQMQVVAGVSVGQVGQGILDIGGGVTVAGSGASVTVGFQAGSNGSVQIVGPGSFLTTGSALVSIGHDAGSTGDLQVDGGGLLQIGSTGGGSLHVGDSGKGSMEIATLSTSAMVQVGSGATFEVGSQAGSSGSVDVAGPDGLTLNGPAIIGNEGTGTLDVESYPGGGSASASASGNFYVGGDLSGAASTGNGTVAVTGGGQFAVTGGASANCGVGNGVGAVGEIYVQDAGSSLKLTSPAIAGVYGVGQFAASGGASAQSLTLQLGATAGAVGNLLVYNSGTVWTNTTSIILGGGPGQMGGQGNILVNDNALLRIYRKLSISSKSLVDVTKVPPNNSVFPVPVAPITATPKGRIFVGTDNFGPDGTVRVGRGGVLTGKGKQLGLLHTNVLGNVVIGLGGQFLPGGDPDVFSIQGDCDLSDGGKAGGETDIEVAGTGAAGTDYDQIVATGKVTLGGTLKLVLMEGYKPQAGDTIEPVKAKTTTGNFKEVVTPGLTLSSNFNAGKLSVKVMSVANIPAPMITSDKTATGHVGAAFSYQIVATGLPAGYAATGLPVGLDIDPSTGLISGTPTTPGTSSVTISSTSVGGTGKETLQLQIMAPVSASPAITLSEARVEAVPDAAFSYHIQANNSPTSYAASGLPPGLNVNTVTGVISGKPTQDGNYLVTLSATNATGTGTAKLKLVVALPAVQVAATVPEIAVGSGKDGEFTLSIPAPLKTPLTIHFQISGSAEPGKDYVALANTAVIKAGQTTKVVKVVPRGDLDGAMNKIVTLTLVKEAGYTLHAPEHAKVKIVAGE